MTSLPWESYKRITTKKKQKQKQKKNNHRFRELPSSAVLGEKYIVIIFLWQQIFCVPALFQALGKHCHMV